MEYRRTEGTTMSSLVSKSTHTITCLSLTTILSRFRYALSPDSNSYLYGISYNDVCIDVIITHPSHWPNTWYSHHIKPAYNCVTHCCCKLQMTRDLRTVTTGAVLRLYFIYVVKALITGCYNSFSACIVAFGDFRL